MTRSGADHGATHLAGGIKILLLLSIMELTQNNTTAHCGVIKPANQIMAYLFSFYNTFCYKMTRVESNIHYPSLENIFSTRIPCVYTFHTDLDIYYRHKSTVPNLTKLDITLHNQKLSRFYIHHTKERLKQM
jgi:hypothetical protein